MNTNRIRIFNRQAIKYARRRYKKGIDHKWRKELLQDLEGNILEVAVGAGANFRFYSKEAKVTAVDISPDMLNHAKLSASENRINAVFVLDNIENLSFAPGSFDAIVSTFSLCAYDRPVDLLNHFNIWCKPGGQILMLEHGVGNNALMKWGQQIVDPLQYKLAGCHLNRDIRALIGLSDLELVSLRRKMLGMIYLVQAVPGVEGE